MKATKRAKRVTATASFIMVDVDNPDYQPQHRETQSNPRKISANISMRESPALWMHSHGHIDTTQLEVAGKFRRLYETTGGAGVKAMDTTKEPVDGGFMHDGLTDAKQQAAKELQAVRDRIGQRRFDLVEKVCGECLWIKELAEAKRQQGKIADELRVSLDILASFWGLTGKGQSVAGVRAQAH